MTLEKFVEDYARDGFVVIENALDERQIARAAAGVQWAMEHVGGDYKWIKQCSYDWFREQPIFVELIEHPLVLDLARAWLGNDFHLIAAQCSRNTREDNYAPGAMTWHQDDVFFPAATRRTAGVADERYGFSAMFMVQDIPLEMGPTETIRGSFVSGDDYREGPSDETLLSSRAYPAGSLLIFSHRTWHRGQPNTTDRPRDLITNAYARREVDKVQLLSKTASGEREYVRPANLIEQGSPMLRQLLA